MDCLQKSSLRYVSISDIEDLLSTLKVARTHMRNLSVDHAVLHMVDIEMGKAHFQLGYLQQIYENEKGKN